MNVRKTMTFIGALLIGSGYLFSQDHATPAFPTAEGYGKWASGGRGGKVVEVTTVEDDGIGDIPGSLRWALKQHPSDPVTIVFRTSGIIDLKGIALRCKRNNYTIAGQTAPGDGICIKGGTLNLGGSQNVIVRHIRVRVGKKSDGTFISGPSIGFENGGNFIIDHCSFSWSAEENCDFYDNLNQTVQWCMFTEGLYGAGHAKGSRSYGSVFGGRNSSIHHNLIAHNVSRSPRFGTSTKNDVHMFVDFVNNLNYNWGRDNACYGGENKLGANGSVNINFINNYYKPGPAYPGTNRSNFTRASYANGMTGTNYSKYFLNGNLIEGSANKILNTDNYAGLDIRDYQAVIKTVTVNDLKRDKMPSLYPVSTETAKDAYKSVLEKAGAFPRDRGDERIVKEVKSGKAKSTSSFKAQSITGILDKPEDCGGYQTYKTYNTIKDNDHDGIDDTWETRNGLDPQNVEDGNLKTHEGYTALEVYINEFVGEYIPHKFTAEKQK